MTGHLQMDKQSTKNGAIIQYAAFRQLRLQKVITEHYDNAFESKWGLWMQTQNENGKGSMRINSIIKKKVIPFTKQQLSDYVNTLSSRHSISIKIRDFYVAAEEIENVPIGNYIDNYVDDYIDDGLEEGIIDTTSSVMTVAPCIDTNAGDVVMDDHIHQDLPPLPPPDIIPNQPQDLPPPLPARPGIKEQLQQENNKLKQQLAAMQRELYHRRTRIPQQALQSNHARGMNMNFSNNQMSRRHFSPYPVHQTHDRFEYQQQGMGQYYPSADSQSMITEVTEPPFLSPSVSGSSNDTVDDCLSQSYGLHENSNNYQINALEVPSTPAPIPMQHQNGYGYQYQATHGTSYHHTQSRIEPYHTRDMSPSLPGFVPSNNYCHSVCYTDHGNNFHCYFNNTASDEMSYTHSSFDTMQFMDTV